MKPSLPIDIVLLGAGHRGHHVYGQWALEHPHELRFVAVAEPDPLRRTRFAEAHGIPAKRQFRSWQELIAAGRLAPALLNATMDTLHADSTLAALDAGYHILLEKPMALTPEAVRAMVARARERERLLMVCHVLRYAPFFHTVHEIIRSGRLGEIITVEHRENVSFWHMAHAYVRGNWRNTEVAAPMILAKSCHDLDLLVWNLGRRCERVASFGRLTHFRPDKIPYQPADAVPDYCLDGCPIAAACPWYAPHIYLPHLGRWPTVVLTPDQSGAGVLHALEQGPYGRCVYRCDNNVVDHHVATFEFEGGITVTFTMHGHSHEEGRTMRYDGSLATLRASEPRQEIEIIDHRSGERHVIQSGASRSGHGGGDAALMESFVRVLRGEEHPLTSAELSMESHLIAFAAEQARIEGRVVEMEELRQ
ncbi:MAG: Gfo/Idh/MocA family oxidoreductase [Chloroflexota bacterium]|nr:Gfo/Idh/MocA family oxidoreductase [Chloroflexota bacterium]